MKFNVKFSAVDDDINLTLWLDVDSSDACQPSALARFDKDGRHLSKLPTFEYARRLPAAGKEVMLNSLSLFQPDYILHICIALQLKLIGICCRSTIL